jgi:3' terminal RNA ribose 2'-O-methyltransferase Hen1
MIITIIARGSGCQSLSHLLHKHPGKVYQSELPFGLARVFYPKYGEAECRVVLAVDLDNVEAVRGGADWALGKYVSDRPYTASSLLCVAISKVFRSAVAGKCLKDPPLVEQELDLEFQLPAVKVSEEMCLKLFGPLGYRIQVGRGPSEDGGGEWEAGGCVWLVGRKTGLVRDLLNHLLVLIPAMDHGKHYWVEEGEVDKLLTQGKGWLEDHPQRDFIVRTCLKKQGKLIRDFDNRIQLRANQNQACGKRDLHSVRLDTVLRKIFEFAPSSVVDLGCGEGKFLTKLLEETNIPKISGMDVSTRAIGALSEKLDRYYCQHRGRARLFAGSLVYRDIRIAGFDAAVMIEVIEHIDPERLHAVETAVFGDARPRRVIVTTPNRDYNCLFVGLGGGLRHGGHRFEWTRGEFEKWAEKISDEYGYTFCIKGIGDEHPEYWTPSQMAIFEAV